jgi:hypothetical protein
MLLTNHIVKNALTFTCAMYKTIYILKSGKLSRENNTVLFETSDEKKFLPIENIRDIYIFSEIIRGVSFHEKSTFQENYWFYKLSII